MRPISILHTIAAVALLSAPVALQAQGRATASAGSSNDRAGYSLSVGVGGGSSGISCTNCTTERSSSGSGYLRVGKGMSPSLMMGLELNAWNKTEATFSDNITMLSAIAQYYPSMTNGFFVKTGAGMGRLTSEAQNVTPPSDKLQSTGFGYQFGMGYDMSIARRWSITPYVNYLATAGAKGKFNGVDMNTTVDGNYVQYGLGLSWH